MSFFGATGTPVLDFWWRLLWVSKPEWVLPYSLFLRRRMSCTFPRFTSGATLADLLALVHSRSLPTCMCRGGTWLGFARTEDERATIVPATRLIMTQTYCDTCSQQEIFRVDVVDVCSYYDESDGNCSCYHKHTTHAKSICSIPPVINNKLESSIGI